MQYPDKINNLRVRESGVISNPIPLASKAKYIFIESDQGANSDLQEEIEVLRRKDKDLTIEVNDLQSRMITIEGTVKALNDDNEKKIIETVWKGYVTQGGPKTVSEAYEEVVSDISALNSQLNSVETIISDNIEPIKADIDILKGRISTLETSSQNHEQRIKTLEVFKDGETERNNAIINGIRGGNTTDTLASLKTAIENVKPGIINQSIFAITSASAGFRVQGFTADCSVTHSKAGYFPIALVTYGVNSFTYGSWSWFSLGRAYMTNLTTGSVIAHVEAIGGSGSVITEGKIGTSVLWMRVS